MAAEFLREIADGWPEASGHLRAAADLFEIDEYMVSKAVYSTDKELDASPGTSFIAGKHCLIGYCSPTPSLLTPSAGYIFADKNYGGNDEGIAVSKWWSDEYKSDVVEAYFNIDQKQVTDECGYFFDSVIS